MIERDGWIYYPETDLFVEKVSIQLGRFTPDGKPRFLARSRQVYGREVYDTPPRVWQDFLDGHPLAILAVDAWVGHPTLAKMPSAGGLYDPDAFAVHNEEKIRGRYVG